MVYYKNILHNLSDNLVCWIDFLIENFLFHFEYRNLNYSKRNAMLFKKYNCSASLGFTSINQIE